MFFRKKDPDERHAHEMHFSDWGVILIAFILSLAAVYLLVTPEDYGAYFAKAGKALSNVAPAQQAQPQAHPGETPMMLFDAKKK